MWCVVCGCVAGGENDVTPALPANLVQQLPAKKAFSRQLFTSRKYLAWVLPDRQITSVL